MIMEINIKGNKLVMTTQPKIIYFNLPKDLVVLNLVQRLDLRSLKKHVALQTCLFITRGKT